MAELPEWQPLSEVPTPVADNGGIGRIVALLASEQAVAEGWASSSALALARSWSAAGTRVILVDGVLHDPSLHQEAGLPNRVGLSDVALHGASIDHVTQAIDDGALFLVSAGTPVADPEGVARSPRWHRVTTGMCDAGVVMALLLRDGEQVTSAFLGSASDIVVLAAPGDATPPSVRDFEPLVCAVTGPESVGPNRGTGRSPSPEVGVQSQSPSTGEVRGKGRLVAIALVLLAAVLALAFLVIG
jgi:hypothetical protein